MQHKRKRRTMLAMKPNQQESSDRDNDNEQYWVFPVGSQVHPQSAGRRTARPTNRSNDSAATTTTMEWTCRDFHFRDKVWIGSGQFGHVYKVQQQSTNQQQQEHCVALKQFDKEHFTPDRQRRSRTTRRYKPTLQLLHDEINIHSHLQHDNILSMLGYFHDTSSLYLVLEYTPHGDLKRHLFRNQYTNHGPSTNDAISRQVVLHMTQALAYLQTLQIAHRDLKPENILVTTVDHRSTATPSSTSRNNTNYKFQLADFGWATWWRHNGRRHTTLCGTPEFVPPELLVHESYDPKWVDSWALGLLALEVRYGCTPFGGNATHDIFDKIRQFYYQLSYKDAALWFPSDERDDEDDDDEQQQQQQQQQRANWRDFVTSLLQRDPIERMTAQEALEHDYLQPPQEPLLSVDHAGDHDASTSSQVYKPTQCVQQKLSSPSVAQRCQLFEQTAGRKQQCFESIAVEPSWDNTSDSSNGSDSTRNTSFSDCSSKSCSDGDFWVIE